MLANERCAFSSSQIPRVSVTWHARHQRRARHSPRSPPPPHVRAHERASAAAAAAAAAAARAWVVVVVVVLSSLCRVVGCVGSMGVVEGGGAWGVVHEGVALTSAPRSRAHVRYAAWRRTQRQMSERANAATATMREGAVT